MFATLKIIFSNWKFPHFNYTLFADVAGGARSLNCGLCENVKAMLRDYGYNM